MQDSDSRGSNPTSGRAKERRNRRILIIILAFSCALAIILFSLILYFVLKKDPEVCLTRDCTLTAATLISAMDHTIDPCEDFYKFTCANFFRKNPIPDHKEIMSTFFLYEDRLLLQLKYLIEDYTADNNDPKVVTNMQEMYHLCINTSYNEENEFAALKSYIEDVFDGWPIAHGSRWKSKFERFDDYMANILSHGVDNLPLVYISLEEIHDETTKETKKQPTINYKPVYSTLQFTSPDKAVKFENEKSKKEIEVERENRMKMARAKFLKELLKLFGNSDEFAILRDIQQMESYDDYTRKVYREATNGTINRTEMTIKELTEALNKTIDWLKIFNLFFRGKHTFTNSSKVFIVNLDALMAIPKILKQFSRRIVVNSFIYHNLREMTADSGVREIEKLADEFIQEIAGEFHIIWRKIPRWDVCLQYMRISFPMVLTRLFVNKFVDRNGKVTVDEMIHLIQEAYKGRLENSKWLDDSTKQRALIKADTIQRFVAYPDFIFNNEEIEKEYHHIPFPNSTWFWTNVRLKKILNEKFWEKSPEDSKTKWDIDPLTINAFYEPTGNSIWFPSGILQLPFFDENRLAAVNFGMIGSVIGHEIGHAFDDSGSRYNERGDEEMWWSNKTWEIFQKKTECFINQYNNYCPEELQGGKDNEKICVNGEDTLGENLADNTGVVAAFDAYKLWIKKYGEEPRLPGLEQYSPNQVFFISFGYIECKNIPPDKLNNTLNDVHSPGNYRVLGPLSNMPEFREAFNCKKGPYNRGSDSCVVW